jgi:hypothetical protein
VTASAIPAFAGEEDGFGVTSLDARCITDANTVSYKASGVDYESNEHIDLTYAVYKDGNYVGNGSPTNLYVSGSGSWSAPTAFKALRNISLCPWKIGTIVAAALVILHIEHDRTT